MTDSPNLRGLSDPRRHRPGCGRPPLDASAEGRWRITICPPESGGCGAVDVALAEPAS
ncbi:MAG: hypothetical protein R2737_11895 [Candidatus Nanopelagicales bacterium]